MVEQQKALSLADILATFRPAEAPKTNANAPSGVSGFQDMLDRAITALKPYEAITSQNAEAQPVEAISTNSPKSYQSENALHNQPNSNVEQAKVSSSENQLAPSLGENVVKFDSRASIQNKRAVQKEFGDINAKLSGEPKVNPMAQHQQMPKEFAPNQALIFKAPMVEVPVPLEQKTAFKSTAKVEANLKPTQLVKGQGNQEALQELPANNLNPSIRYGDRIISLNRPNKEHTTTPKLGSEPNNLNEKQSNVISQTLLGQESRAVQDAVRLVKELSGRYGASNTNDKDNDKNDAKVEAKDSRRIDRFELLRRDRIEANGTSRRVEVLNNSRHTGEQTAIDSRQLAGLNSIRVEDTAPRSQDLKFYNPTMPQAIIHHSINLPANTSPTMANFAQVLRTQLREGLNNEIAGQAKILLSGNEKGEVRLVLHPESLGEVRINLKIEDSTIGGQIFVENKEVLEVFKENLADMLAAFKAGGLDASGLELTVQDRGGNGGNAEQHDRRNDKQFQQYAVESFDDSVPVVRFHETGKNSLVDVVV